MHAMYIMNFSMILYVGEHFQFFYHLWDIYSICYIRLKFKGGSNDENYHFLKKTLEITCPLLLRFIVRAYFCLCVYPSMKIIILQNYIHIIRSCRHKYTLIHTHTHTRTHTQIYSDIYIYIILSLFFLNFLFRLQA